MGKRKKLAVLRPMRSEALIAIAFAGGMLNSQLPALSGTEGKTESTDSIIQRIANDGHMQPELRAYYLLRLATELLSGKKRSVVEEQFIPVLKEQTRVWSPKTSKQWLSVLASWSDRVMSDADPSNFGFSSKKVSKSDESISDENKKLANTAIQLTLAQLDKASDKSAKLYMYLIASQLYQRIGNPSGVTLCNKVLDSALQACEGKSPTDEEQMQAATSVLNSMAYGLIPIVISDVPKNNFGETQSKTFTEKNFKESETLKLRAAAMADRLDAKNHLRRKTHRDLVLWYTQLGKTELAEKEKLVLFKLVGSNDESILYPQYEGCGKLLWWVAEKRLTSFDCGRG